MQKSKEFVFMLRLWQQETNDDSYHVSLKPIGQNNQAAKYFHDLSSLQTFLNNHKFVDKNSDMYVSISD